MHTKISTGTGWAISHIQCGLQLWGYSPRTSCPSWQYSKQCLLQKPVRKWLPSLNCVASDQISYSPDKLCYSPVETWWHTVTNGRGSEGETGEWSGWPVPFTLPWNTVHQALLLLMRTSRLPAVDWNDAPADLKGLVRFTERWNLDSACVPSHFKRSLHSTVPCHIANTVTDLFKGWNWQVLVHAPYRLKMSPYDYNHFRQCKNHCMTSNSGQEAISGVQSVRNNSYINNRCCWWC